MIIDMKLNKTLKRLLNESELSATELSKLTDIPLSTLHGWINGVEPKSISQLKKIADFFDVSLDFLCFGEPKSKNIKDFGGDISIGNYEVILRRIRED